MASETLDTGTMNDNFNVTASNDQEWTVWEISGSIALYAFMAYIAWLALIIVLAALNLSFGVRSLYIEVMLKIFEVSHQFIININLTVLISSTKHVKMFIFMFLLFGHFRI